ncbi:MAG: SLC45 family MFS transporter [Bacteroidales bacterium]|nr:SLC45 family MFS transporter [Candidatus Hennigimonas equi]
MARDTKLSLRSIFDLNFGFFGVQIAYALQSANISRIFATLGADPHQLSFFWILPPLMGMLVQPLVGKYSDRTWCRMGRRKPYLLGGALVALLVMLMLPNAGSIDFGTKAFLGLNGAMWFGLFSLMLLDTSINVAMQPFKMMVGDMVGENQKAQGYSVQSFLCNAGSLVGYLFPIFLTWIGLANTAPAGVVPDSVIWSFYCGAAILILCVLYTFFRVKEMAPEEYAEFHSLTADGNSGVESSESLLKLLVRAPGTFWTVSLVQFFCWASFLLLWTYTNGAIADTCWGVTDAASEGYQAAGNWVGLLFAVEAVGAMVWAVVIPRFKTLKLAYAVSLVLGAAGFLSVFFIHDRWLLFVSFLLIGFVWAAMLAIPFTLVTNALTDHIGTYLGLFNCSICFPQIVAAAAGGWILSLVGGSQAAMFIIAAVLLLLGAACTALINEHNKQ